MKDTVDRYLFVGLERLVFFNIIHLFLMSKF